MSRQGHEMSALEEMVTGMLTQVDADPSMVIDRAWCQGVVELLLAMDPALAFPLLRRARQVLQRHAHNHGCAAPTVFHECYEAHLATLAVR